MTDETCTECDRPRRLCGHGDDDARILRALRRAFAGEDLDAVGHGRVPDAIARAAAVCRTLDDILNHQP